MHVCFQTLTTLCACACVYCICVCVYKCVHFFVRACPQAYLYVRVFPYVNIWCLVICICVFVYCISVRVLCMHVYEFVRVYVHLQRLFLYIRA